MCTPCRPSIRHGVYECSLRASSSYQQPYGCSSITKNIQVEGWVYAVAKLVTKTDACALVTSACAASIRTNQIQQLEARDPANRWQRRHHMEQSCSKDRGDMRACTAM